MEKEKSISKTPKKFVSPEAVIIFFRDEVMLNESGNDKNDKKDDGEWDVLN